MLPYPTDRRRLLMMVRAFLHEFAAIVSAHGDGWQDPSAADPWADHQFEAFLERLAVDASQVDEDAAVMETEVEVQHSIQQHLCDLLQHAAWHRDRIRWN